MKTHYHVFCGMPGCLPDNEPDVFTSRRDAEAAAKWYADGYRDIAADDPESAYRITGSARKGHYTVTRFGWIVSITIDPCTDTTCALNGAVTP